MVVVPVNVGFVVIAVDGMDVRLAPDPENAPLNCVALTFPLTDTLLLQTRLPCMVVLKFGALIITSPPLLFRYNGQYAVEAFKVPVAMPG
jgi:hypothetical protein